MQFGFRFQILLFTTSERFSTKTLAYLAYNKAFMAFKRSRLNPFQNYRSITSFSVDWPRTIRLVYASVSISSVCAIMLQVIVIQTRWNTKRPTKEFSKQKYRARHVTQTCPCMTTSIIIKITRDQQVNTFTLIGSQLVVMVLRAQWPLGTIARSVNHAMSWSKIIIPGWICHGEQSACHVVYYRRIWVPVYAWLSYLSFKASESNYLPERFSSWISVYTTCLVRKLLNQSFKYMLR